MFNGDKVLLELKDNDTVIRMNGTNEMLFLGLLKSQLKMG